MPKPPPGSLSSSSTIRSLYSLSCFPSFSPLPSAEANMDVFSLHIWPRGSHFLMALPNHDHSYTITLFVFFLFFLLFLCFFLLLSQIIPFLHHPPYPLFSPLPLSYLPEKDGELSFAGLNTPAKVKKYFEDYYPDAVGLMPDFEVTSLP